MNASMNSGADAGRLQMMCIRLQASSDQDQPSGKGVHVLLTTSRPTRNSLRAAGLAASKTLTPTHTTAADRERAHARDRQRAIDGTWQHSQPGVHECVVAQSGERPHYRGARCSMTRRARCASHFPAGDCTHAQMSCTSSHVLAHAFNDDQGESAQLRGGTKMDVVHEAVDAFSSRLFYPCHQY
jgi:hypothetical protein